MTLEAEGRGSLFLLIQAEAASRRRLTQALGLAIMLRIANPSDLEQVFSIYMHEDVIPFLGHDPMPREAFVPIFKKFVESQTFFVWGGEGSVRGFCQAIRHEGRAAHGAYLRTFAVHPEERGSGLATELLSQLIRYLQKHGIKRVELMLEEDNPRALAFYKRLGFELEGTVRAAYKRASQPYYVNELFMGKLLVPLSTKGEA